MTTPKKSAKRKTRRKNEKLLCTCSTLLDRETVRAIANDLLGKMLYSAATGKYWQVMSVRVSGHKIYGEVQEMQESGYMFSPVKASATQDTLF